MTGRESVSSVGDISICVNIFHLLVVESLDGRSLEIQKTKGIWFSSVSSWRCPTAQELASMSCYILPCSEPQLSPFLLLSQMPPTVPVFASQCQATWWEKLCCLEFHICSINFVMLQSQCDTENILANGWPRKPEWQHLWQGLLTLTVVIGTPPLNARKGFKPGPLYSLSSEFQSECAPEVFIWSW